MSATVSFPFFRFVRVENFFSQISSPDAWDRVTDVVAESFDAHAKTLELKLATTAAGLPDPVLLIHVIRANTYRIRFNPGKNQRAQHPAGNSRAIVLENINQAAILDDSFQVQRTTEPGKVILTTSQNAANQMRIIVNLAPFGLKAQSFEDGEWVTVLEDAKPAIYFRRIQIDDWKGEEWSIVLARKKFPYTKYIGFGEKGGGKLCQNGAQLTYFNYDNMRYRQVYNKGPLDPREPLYDTNPFFLEFSATPNKSSVAGTFIDNTSELCLDIGFQSTERVLLGSFFGDMDVYEIVATCAAEVFKAHVQLIGTPRLKPRYVLGYHQGCYGYENRDTLLAVAKAFRDNRFPIDGLHVDVDVQDRYRTFTIDEQKFPDPKGMFQELRNQGIKCSTNITPIISNRGDDYETFREGRDRGFFITDNRALQHLNNIESHQDFDNGHENFFENFNSRINTGQPFEGEVYYGGDRGTPGHYPDFGRKEVRIWWGEQYKFLFDMGLEFVWQDMTSPCIRDTRGDMRSLPFDLLLTDDSVRKFESDGVTPSDDTQNPVYPKAPFITIQSLFSYNLHKATYYGLNALPTRAGLRNFIIGRGAFAGTQRFAGLWTGDNASDWEFYRINVPQVLGLGMSGQPIAGADIGGFEGHNGESWVNPELFIRWMIAGALLPWFRNHYIAKGVKEFQEPYRFASVVGRVPPQDVFLYESVLPVTRYYVELRYRLLQVFYDAMFENVCSGLPIVRPLFLHDDQDLSLFSDKLAFLDDEFMLGKDLLVAPVMHPRTDPKGGERDIYLPAGNYWYLFMNALKPLEAAVVGGSTIRFDASINSDARHIPFILPIYVRVGAIVPMIELEQFVGERRLRENADKKDKDNPVTLHIFPGQEGKYTMYLDDGVSRASAMEKNEELGGDPEAKGLYQEVIVTHRRTGPDKRRIEIEIGQNKFKPQEEYFFVAVLHDPGGAKGIAGPLQEVKLEGTTLPLLDGGTIAQRSDRLWDSSVSQYYYHEAANITYIKVFYGNASKALDLTYTAQLPPIHFTTSECTAGV